MAANSFFANFKVLSSAGYLELKQYSFGKKTEEAEKTKEKEQEGETETACDENLLKILSSLKKSDIIDWERFLNKGRRDFTAF